MLPIVKIVIVASLIALAAVGTTIGIIYAATPITVTDPCRDITPPTTLEYVVVLGSAILSWNRASAPSGCEINFAVSYYVNGELVQNGSTYGNQYVFPISALPGCSIINFTLRAISEGKHESAPVIAETTTDIDEISSITLDGDAIVWIFDNDQSRCTFRIEMNDEVVHENFDDTIYDLSAIPMCQTNEITVTPIHFNGDVGTPKSFQFERAFQPITAMSLTVLNRNVVQVIYDLIDNIDLCTERIGFQGFRFDCTLEESAARSLITVPFFNRELSEGSTNSTPSSVTSSGSTIDRTDSTVSSSESSESTSTESGTDSSSESTSDSTVTSVTSSESTDGTGSSVSSIETSTGTADLNTSSSEGSTDSTPTSVSSSETTIDSTDSTVSSSESSETTSTESGTGSSSESTSDSTVTSVTSSESTDGTGSSVSSIETSTGTADSDPSSSEGNLDSTPTSVSSSETTIDSTDSTVSSSEFSESTSIESGTDSSSESTSDSTVTSVTSSESTDGTGSSVSSIETSTDTADLNTSSSEGSTDSTPSSVSSSESTIDSIGSSVSSSESTSIESGTGSSSESTTEITGSSNGTDSSTATETVDFTTPADSTTITDSTASFTESTTTIMHVRGYHNFEDCTLESNPTVFTMSIQPITTGTTTTVDIICSYTVTMEVEGVTELSLTEDSDSICPTY